MEEAFEKCLKCGHSLDEAGGCRLCGFERMQHAKPGFVEKFRRLLRGRQIPKLELGDASLVNSKTSDAVMLSEPVVSIGRDLENDIVIPDNLSVSRKHACVQFIDQGFWIENFSTTNCTLLNGKRLTKRTQLEPDDIIQIGDTELLFEAHSVPEFTNYEILSKLAEGGSTIVYEAMERRSKRKVAIKQLVLSDASVNKRRTQLARFRREGMLARRLKHPNIVSVYDLTLGPSAYYYVMEFMDGCTLQEFLRQKGGRCTPEEFLPILEAVASALAYAHSMKIVHRDVKPDNIFILPGGKIKLADFGVAHVESSDQTPLTRSGSFLGTLRYSSPEQINNPKQVDNRADIFSLAVLCYEALSGELPFDGKGVVDIVNMITRERERPLYAVAPEVGEITSEVIARALSKKPNYRHSSVIEFAQDFRRSLSYVYNTVS